MVYLTQPVYSINRVYYNPSCELCTTNLLGGMSSWLRGFNRIPQTPPAMGLLSHNCSIPFVTSVSNQAPYWELQFSSRVGLEYTPYPPKKNPLSSVAHDYLLLTQQYDFETTYPEPCMISPTCTIYVVFTVTLMYGTASLAWFPGSPNFATRRAWYTLSHGAVVWRSLLLTM